MIVKCCAVNSRIERVFRNTALPRDGPETLQRPLATQTGPGPM